MARIPDKNTIARKMFDEGDPDDLFIDTERSTKRVTIRDEANVSLIKRRSPAQFIPLSSIVKRSAAQIRLTDFDPEKYPEDKCLLESIRNRGVVTPVMVKEYLSDDDDLLADSKYELIYGHRRVSACKVLGFTTIPAFVVDSTVNAADVTMTENIGVRTLNAYERGREFTNYLAEHNISMRSLAELNGFSHGYVSKLIDAYRASRKSPEIESLFQDGRLYFRDVPELADLYEKSDEPSRELLVEMLAFFEVFARTFRAAIAEVLAVEAFAMEFAVVLAMMHSAALAAVARTVVLGTVRGDLHDIGKNLVKIMMEGSGLEVIDAGCDVSAEDFIQTAIDKNCDMIACSTLLTTSMGEIERVVQEAVSHNIRDKVKILIGGAPVTQEYCDKVGADGYTPDAAAAARLAVKMLS